MKALLAAGLVTIAALVLLSLSYDGVERYSDGYSCTVYRIGRTEVNVCERKKD